MLGWSRLHSEDTFTFSASQLQTSSWLEIASTSAAWQPYTGANRHGGTEDLKCRIVVLNIIVVIAAGNQLRRNAPTAITTIILVCRTRWNRCSAKSCNYSEPYSGNL